MFVTIACQAAGAGESIQFSAPGAPSLSRIGLLDLPSQHGKPVPVVVMLPGTDGIDERQAFYREQLLAAGIGTFAIDLKSGIFTAARDRPDADYFLGIGFAALKVLRGRPEVDGRRIGVMGWSAGATIAGRLAYQSHIERWLGAGQAGFAAFVGLYGGCTRQRIALSPAPILILIGASDTHTDPNRCRAFQAQQPNVSVVIYPGVHHGFDKEGVDRATGNRIMRWDHTAAMDARKRVIALFAKELGGR